MSTISAASGSRYLQFLPEIFHDDKFLGRFLLIFETLWEPLEQRQDHIAMSFAPGTCPALFLEWFAGWLDLDVMTRLPERRFRSLLGGAAQLHRWRGTKKGLTDIIKICTGITPEIEEASQAYMFHIKLSLPADASFDKNLVEKLIETQKPAHAGYVLEVE